jgi:hypothetical protein
VSEIEPIVTSDIYGAVEFPKSKSRANLVLAKRRDKMFVYCLELSAGVYTNNGSFVYSMLCI